MANLEEYLKTFPKKNLIFDFDETIVKLKFPWHIYYWEVLAVARELGFLEADNFSSIALLTNALVQKYKYMAYGKLMQTSVNFEKNYYRGYEPNRELTDFIRRRHTDYNCYIYSSNHRTTIETVLRDLDLLQCFKKLVTKDDVSFLKPDAEGFKFIYQNDNKLDYLMIGDSEDSDKVMAEKVGIGFFLVDKFRDNHS